MQRRARLGLPLLEQSLEGHFISPAVLEYAPNMSQHWLRIKSHYVLDGLLLTKLAIVRPERRAARSHAAFSFTQGYREVET